jgi:hypothetical protein
VSGVHHRYLLVHGDGAGNVVSWDFGRAPARALRVEKREYAVGLRAANKLG